MRVAVVGTGSWGEQHARVFARRPDTELVAIVGRDAARAETRAAAYGTTAYTDLDEMIARTSPDLVTISLPNEQHYETTLRVIRAGVPLLVEKPLVFHLAEADSLLAEAAARDLFFAINFNHRYAEPVQRAAGAIREGAIGEPVFAMWRFGGEANHGTSRHANLIETQCHGFDMLEHLVGPIASVAAQMTDKTYGDWSTVAIAVEFANRAVGTMLGSYDSSYAYPDAQLIEINGTTGRVVLRDTVREFSLQRVGDESATVWRAGYFNDEARNFHGTFDRHVDAVLTALRTGAQPPVPASAGRRALRLALAVIESQETGRRVHIDPESAPGHHKSDL